MAHGIYRSHVIGTLTGHAAPVLNYPEAASQTFVEGDFVYLASGYLTVCGSDPTVILGMALEPAHNTTAGLYTIGVALALEITLFGMSVRHTTAGNAVIEAADMGKLYDILASSAGHWTVDKDASTTTSRVKVLKFVEALGTLYGLVACTVVAANRQVGV